MQASTQAQKITGGSQQTRIEKQRNNIHSPVIRLLGIPEKQTLDTQFSSQRENSDFGSASGRPLVAGVQSSGGSIGLGIASVRVENVAEFQKESHSRFRIGEGAIAGPGVGGEEKGRGNPHPPPTADRRDAGQSR
ncbi:hypothetical protein AXG93_2841s1170 [Marchantia polymorpha subsp. ruderalis]|uniref:Uncharacterized protein n=1 Tax=Marchantia polymorpha subsp. ruderalis TaxID=1480154 RepID=A0A176WSR2_MARPO|nr:hypothetical protein AXG93_2841s1170 [Marchantia polymorpha subsp. ruderalis]